MLEREKNNNNSYDLANLPLFERENFDYLLEQGKFGEFNNQAIDLRNKGFCNLAIKNKFWLENIDKLKLELSQSEEFKSINKDNPNPIRFQDAWLHKKSKLVKEIATHKEILKCLSILFGRESFPFQTLNFPYGSSQHFHSDASHFNSLPYGFMCGVWVAMEDIHKDAGPLIYYPYSHKSPYISSKSLGIKSFQIKKTQAPQQLFEKYWQDLIKKFNFKKEQFIAKKGDILIWHPNLIHGGEKIKNKKLTRWSQVTHYFFKNCAYYTPFFDTEDDEFLYKKWRTPLNLLEIN